MSRESIVSLVTHDILQVNSKRSCSLRNRAAAAAAVAVVADQVIVMVPLQEEVAVTAAEVDGDAASTNDR